MSDQVKSESKLITDIFVEGARKGWNIAIHSTIPNVLMAFVIIYVLNVSGLLKLLGEYVGFVMLPLGLPGESIAVFLASFLSWGGAAGVLVALVQEGTLNAQHIAILIPGMALVGSTVQYMGRVKMALWSQPEKVWSLIKLNSMALQPMREIAQNEDVPH